MDPIDAVRRAAARHAVPLTHEAARDIADAVLSAYAQTVTVRHTFNAAMWNSEAREHLEQGMRRELLFAVADAGMVPTDLPIKTTTRLDNSEFAMRGDVEISMTVHVRKPQTVAATA